MFKQYFSDRRNKNLFQNATLGVENFYGIPNKEILAIKCNFIIEK